MKRRVAIVGYKLMKNTRASEWTRERIYYELSKSLLEELEIKREDIDTFIFASNDFADGRTISEVYLVQRIGAYMRDESKVEQEALNACLYAWLRIQSGEYDTAMVGMASLASSQFKPLLVQNHELDPVYERPRGLINFYSGAAFQARAYMERFKNFTESHIARYAEKGYRNALKNQYSLQIIPPSIEKIENSDPIYLPIRELEVAPYADGGGVVILASEEKAKKLTKKPVWIEGVGSAQDTYWIGERDLVKLDGLREAARRAYRMAGIKNPKKEISFAEVQTFFASEEPVIAEALGLFEEGSGAEVIEKGLSEIDGKIPVNPSGGSFGGNPMGGTSLIGLINAVKQLRGEADDFRVEKAKRALVHSQDGVCAQHNTVMILSAGGKK